jgi:hypothetical protein
MEKKNNECCKIQQCDMCNVALNINNFFEIEVLSLENNNVIGYKYFCNNCFISYFC